MSEISERYRTVAGTFTDVAIAVPADAWDNPAPCEGWVARDVVRHLVEWIPPFLESGADVDLPRGPSVDEDPVGAWNVLSVSLQSLLDDQEIATSEFTHEVAGRHKMEDAIAMFCMNDVLIHTWDLARATSVRLGYLSADVGPALPTRLREPGTQR